MSKKNMMSEDNSGRPPTERTQSVLDEYHEAAFTKARTLYGLHRDSVAASRLIWDHVSIDYPNGAERAYRDALKLFGAVEAIIEAERPLLDQGGDAAQYITLASRGGQVVKVTDPGDRQFLSSMDEFLVECQQLLEADERRGWRGRFSRWRERRH